MTIALAQSPVTSYLGGTSAATYNLVSLGSAPTVGNSIVLQFTANGGGPLLTVADSYGNNFTKVIAQGDSAGFWSHIDSEIWWLPSLPSTGGTYTIICGPTTPAVSAAPNGCVFEVSGISLVDQVGGAVDVSGTSTSATATAGGANAVASEFVVAHIWAASPSSAINQPPNSGYTGTLNQYGQISGGYKIISAIETSSAAWSWTTGTFAAGAIATFRGPIGPVQVLPSGPMPRRVFILP